MRESHGDAAGALRSASAADPAAAASPWRPGRTRCRPVMTIVSSPSSPRGSGGSRRSSGRAAPPSSSTVPSSATTQTMRRSWSVPIASSGISTPRCGGDPAIRMRAEQARHQEQVLVRRPRRARRIVPLAWSTRLSMKSSLRLAASARARPSAPTSAVVPCRAGPAPWPSARCANRRGTSARRRRSRSRSGRATRSWSAASRWR